MRSSSLVLLVGFASLTTLLTLLGCQGPQGPPGTTVEPTACINGSISFWENDPTRASAWISLTNIPEIAEVSINGLPISAALGPAGFLNGYAAYWNWQGANSPFVPRDSAHLLINFTQLNGLPGSAWADIQTPGSFEILTSDTSLDSFRFGDTLNLLWSVSEGAQAYQLSCLTNYHYLDTAGLNQYDHYEQQILCYDTTLALPTSLLIPNIEAIDSAYSAWGFFHLEAFSPWIDVGASANVQGDALGYFGGNYSTVAKYFGDQTREMQEGF